MWITLRTLCQQGATLDFFWYFLHTEKDGDNRDRGEKRNEQTAFITTALKQKKLLSFFIKKTCTALHMDIHIQSRNCHSVKTKLWHMVQNGNTQIHHWHSQTFITSKHLADLSHMYVQKAKSLTKKWVDLAQLQYILIFVFQHLKTTSTLDFTRREIPLFNKPQITNTAWWVTVFKDCKYTYWI